MQYDELRSERFASMKRCDLGNRNPRSRVSRGHANPEFPGDISQFQCNLSVTVLAYQPWGITSVFESSCRLHQETNRWMASTGNNFKPGHPLLCAFPRWNPKLGTEMPQKAGTEYFSNHEFFGSISEIKQLIGALQHATYPKFGFSWGCL